MLSQDAAKLFQRQNVKIDYLHIDGDHSKRGVISDFEHYLPLLSAKAVVSIHDLNMQGVQEAISDVRLRHDDWEILTLGDLGAGTAFLRRR